MRCVYNFLLPEGVTSEQHPEGDGELAAVSRQSNGGGGGVLGDVGVGGEGSDCVVSGCCWLSGLRYAG